MAETNDFTIKVLTISRRPLASQPLAPSLEEIQFETDRGVIPGRIHPAPHSSRAVVWVPGIVGSFDGPARGLYPRLAAVLQGDGVTSLRLDYRDPHSYTACVLDTLVAIAYLESIHFNRIALVGHSLGGAVVITAGAASPVIAGVATLSSQNAGTQSVDRLSPCALLAVHGTADPVLPDTCTRDIFSRAQQPKEMILYPGCDHMLNQCCQELDHDLLTWLRRILIDE